ncbi:MAG TPA: peptidase [Candidatus Dormibacteraeota bacterium]|nr:peptidase [Candidatus Dormibacteraeota bacterium]
MNRAQTILLVLILLLIPSLLCAQGRKQSDGQVSKQSYKQNRKQTNKHAGGQTAPLYKVGLSYRTFTVEGSYNWREAKTHGLTSVIWHPTDAAAAEQPQWIGPPDGPLLSAGKAMKDTALVSSPAKFPLILLSHGTGGSALNMAWLGTTLAAHGYIAVAVNHPGNNGNDGYTPQGFSIWWERARDLSVAIDKMLVDSTFGARIDSKRVGAAGFSLGGYTMIEIAGGITDPANFFAFCETPNADGICKSPPEFPDLLERFDQLAKNDAAFQEALHHASDSYRDARVRAVFAMAPALGPAFPAEPLGKISIPVGIVAGAADESFPVASSAKYFAAHIPGAKLTIFAGAVGHYVFLPSCTEQGRKTLTLLCTDGPGVGREAIHSKTRDLALSFFAVNLK